MYRTLTLILVSFLLTSCDLVIANQFAKGTVTETESQKPFSEESEAWDPVILIAVNEKNEIWIDNGLRELDAVRTMLENKFRGVPETRVILIFQCEASAGVVSEVQNDL